MADQPDPSTLTDEELDKILGEEPQEDPTVEEPETPEEGAEEPAEEPEAEEPAVEEEGDPEEEPEEEPQPPSRREQLRIQSLLARLKDSDSVPKPRPTAEALDYETALEADPEIISQLKADRERSNQAMYQQGLEQAKAIQFHTRLEIDAPLVHQQHPQLDKNSKDFHPAVADAVNTMYLSTVGFVPGDEKKGVPDTVRDPGLRYSTYVDSIYELAKEIAGEMTDSTRKNITRQAAKTGLRPDGSSAKKLNLNKAPQDMSDEELDAVIAQALPR